MSNNKFVYLSSLLILSLTFDSGAAFLPRNDRKLFRICYMYRYSGTHVKKFLVPSINASNLNMKLTSTNVKTVVILSPTTFPYSH